MPVAAPQIKKKGKKAKKSSKKPTTAADPEQVEIVREEVVKYSSRIHVTGYLLMAFGTLGAIVSVYKGLNARHIAQSRLSEP